MFMLVECFVLRWLNTIMFMLAEYFMFLLAQYFYVYVGWNFILLWLITVMFMVVEYYVYGDWIFLYLCWLNISYCVGWILSCLFWLNIMFMVTEYFCVYVGWIFCIALVEYSHVYVGWIFLRLCWLKFYITLVEYCHVYVVWIFLCLWELNIFMFVLAECISSLQYNNGSGNNFGIWKISLISNLRRTHVLLKGSTIRTPSQSVHTNISTCFTNHMQAYSIRTNRINGE